MDLKPRSMTSVGSLWTYRVGPGVPSEGSFERRLGCEAEGGMEALRWRCDGSGGAAFCFARYEEKIASAAARFGSSFTTFGIPGVWLFDLERRIDAFPKEPVSGITRRDLEVGAPSVLFKSAKSSMEKLGKDCYPGKSIAYGLCMPSSPTKSSSSGTLWRIRGGISRMWDAGRRVAAGSNVRRNSLKREMQRNVDSICQKYLECWIGIS